MDSDLRELYNEKLLALAAEDPLGGRLDSPQATAKVTSPLCGSRITVDLSLSAGKVSDYGQVVRACTLGRASATVMAQHVLGATPQELRQLEHVRDPQHLQRGVGCHPGGPGRVPPQLGMHSDALHRFG